MVTIGTDPVRARDDRAEASRYARIAQGLNTEADRRLLLQLAEELDERASGASFGHDADRDDRDRENI